MMQVFPNTLIETDEMEKMITAAAKAADYVEGFGVRGCDLTNTDYWVSYARQSMEEQRLNNRLAEYLFTCAKEARDLGVVIPFEYILYDNMTGEHLDRPGMAFLRKQLIPNRRIGGVIFPTLDRLSREPTHIGIFEFEADYCGVVYHYGDAPNGSDPMVQMVRQNLAHAAKYVKLVNRRNNVAGNIGRALKGIAPAFKAAYGYIYRAEYRDDGPRRNVERAWWEVDLLGPDGEPSYHSPAWVIQQLFKWVGQESRTLYWATGKLNEMGIKSAGGSNWTPGKLQKIVRKHCYTGDHAYNVNARVHDPSRALTDITAEIKRTRLQRKPESEWVHFTVPSLVTEELWNKANDALTERGRGRGKQGKTIDALLRGRVYCPRCERPMVVRRDGRQKGVYYHCTSYFRPWAKVRCSYHRFIPAKIWDEVVWNDICSFLRDDRWVRQQLASQQSQDSNIDKLLRLQKFRIKGTETKIERVREGFEADPPLYNLAEAQRRTAIHQETISKAQAEIKRLQEFMKPIAKGVGIRDLQGALQELRDKNLDDASFDNKLELISRLSIKVYPAEDLKTMKVLCEVDLSIDSVNQRVNIPRIEKDSERANCGIVSSAPPYESKSRTDPKSGGIFSGGRGKVYRMVTWEFPFSTV